MLFLPQDNSCQPIQLSTNYSQCTAEASFKAACILRSRDASLACRISVPRKQCMPRGHKQVGLLQVLDDRCQGWLNAGYRGKACCWAHLSSPNADPGKSLHNPGLPTRAPGTFLLHGIWQCFVMTFQYSKRVQEIFSLENKG